MPKFPTTTGGDLARILQKYFNFSFVSKKGSHVKLKNFEKNRTIIIPIHKGKTLPIGTLRDILDHTGIDPEKIKEYL